MAAVATAQARFPPATTKKCEGKSDGRWGSRTSVLKISRLKRFQRFRTNHLPLRRKWAEPFEKCENPNGWRLIRSNSGAFMLKKRKKKYLVILFKKKKKGKNVTVGLKWCSAWKKILKWNKLRLPATSQCVSVRSECSSAKENLFCTKKQQKKSFSRKWTSLPGSTQTRWKCWRRIKKNSRKNRIEENHIDGYTSLLLT